MRLQLTPQANVLRRNGPAVRIRGMIDVPERQPGDPETSAQGETPGVMRSAAVLALGNITSRVLGLARDSILTSLFGAPLVSAYETAALIPNQLYELIIGGMVNSALVPVFSEYADGDRRQELWEIVSAFLSTAVAVLTLLTLLVVGLARPAAAFAGAQRFTDPVLRETTVALLRLAAPAILTLSVASVLTGVLYARKQFTIPAFLPALFNGAVAAMAWLRPEHISSAVYGLLLGSLLQIVAQLPALRDARLRWQPDWRHPVIRRIVRLYLPIVSGLVLNTLVITFSYNLATSTGDASVTYMRRATTLIQFPVGLVVSALSLAILPTLSRQALREPQAFPGTLAGGVRLALVLICPAAVGLYVLAGPIVDLLFGHGAFTPTDVATTARVLQLYLVGLPFVAVDQMLVFASYARHDTLRPALVGVGSMLVYTAVAVGLLRPFGLLALMLADAVKHMVHTSLMAWLLRRELGGLGGYAVWLTALKAALAAGLMGLGVYAVAQLGVAHLPLPGVVGELALVSLPGLAGVALYLALAYAFRLHELWGWRRPG